MNRLQLTGALCALALGFSSSVMASSINIDFGHKAGEPTSLYGAVGEQGIWNQARLGTTSNLIDTNNASTDVSVDVIAQTDGGTSKSPYPDDIDKLLGDNIYSSKRSGGLWDVQFSGLSDGAYRVILYAPSNTAVSTGMMSINGITAGELTGADPISMINGVSYGIYDTVVSGGILTLSGTTTGSEFSYAGLAGVQVSAVPLPMAIWLFGSGLLGLGVVGRRRRH